MTFSQCEPNTIAFQGSEPIFNSACGNNSYQNINGSNPTGSGQTYQWQYSLNGGVWIAITSTGEDLPKTDITNLILLANGNASGNYQIRRIVNDNSPSCSNTSSPVFLYYSDNSGDVSGGSITPVSTTSCSPAVGSLSLQNHTGPIIRWEQSLDGGAWSNISNTSSSYIYNLSAAGTYCFRALVDDICSGTQDSEDVEDDYSIQACVTIIAPPTVANASIVTTPICTTTPLTIITANTPSVGTGAWSVFSGPSGGTFGSITDPNTIFTHNGAGTYVLRWTISNSPCVPSASDATLVVSELPTVADAGLDQIKCMDETFILTGNTPTFGTGAWSIVSGTGSLSGTNPVTISGVSVGTTTTLRWTISNAPCTPSADDVDVTNTNQGPPTPGAISGTAEVCPNTNYLYSIIDVLGTSSYTWTVPTGWSIIDGQGTVSVTVTSGTLGQNGNVSVVSNNSCNSSSPSMLAVTVADNIPPVFDTPPADVTVQCDAPAITDLGWTDNCDGSGNATGNDISDGNTCPEIIVRTWTYIDASGNSGSASQSITIDDTVIPVLASAPSDISVECIEDIPAMTSLSWTDNCDAGGSVLGEDGALIGGECGGTITRIWNVMDGCLNAAITRTQIITVDDTEIPVLASAPADISVECIEDVPAMTSLTWTDNCDAGGSVLGIDGALVGGECGGTITRSWNVMDGCLNVAVTRTQIITVDDTEIPVLASAPADISVECIEDIPAMTSLTWIDNCDAGGSVLGEDGALIGGECGGTITRSWNVMDACLNAAITRTQIITVDDTEIPVLASAPADISVECIEDVPAMTSLTWTDNCDVGGSVIGEDGALMGGECGGTITRSWNVMDGCLNAAITRTQIITVDDTEIPVLASAPADISVECIEDVPAMTSLTWTDNCDAGGSTLGEDGALIGGECGGTITRSWNVMDGCLNAAVTRTQIITVDDTMLPELASAPADISVECIEDVPPMTSLTWTDNCDVGGSVIGVDGALMGGECGGTITRSWNVMDGCLNAAVTRTQIITVDDTEIPVLASAPADISVECIEDVPPMTSLTWTDNCDAGGSVLGLDGALVGGECGGTITRSWNVMDGCLNAAVTRTQIITVDDTMLPELGSAPADISVECIEDIPAMTSLTWTDNCDAGGSVLGEDGALIGGECGGTITRIWNVMDGCLNAAITRTQIITVDDTEIPVLASAPADISVECIEDVPPMTSLTWTDNCDAGGSVLGIDGALVGGECGGTITRIWNVMDGCLNVAVTRTQIITVDDTEIPVLASAPADISVECIEDVPGMTSLTWTDNCDAGGSVLGLDGALVGGECGGTITRSWNVMDGCLNAAITRTQIITIDDTEIPVLASAPVDISVECIEDIPAMTSLTWTDNCDAGGSVIGEDGALIGGECGGTITRSWNVMDGCLNAAVTRTQIITIDDTEIPVLASAPADISVECIEDVPAMTSLTWTDNCDAGGSALGVDGALIGGECGGTITRIWNVMDACLNAAVTRTQIITVDDTEIPVLASAPADISVECIEDIPAMTSLTWTDNCDAGGSVLGEDGALVGGECGGTITRSWNVMDGCLNAAITRTQIITIDDTEIPVLASAPADISVECIEDVPAMTSLTWTDNCDAGGSVLGEDGALVGGECGGTITRSWNVMDGCLNAAITRTQIITVDDTEIPVLASAPADISVECIEDVPAMTSLTWTDNCDAGGSVLGEDGALVGGECGGTITRIWNVMDGCLNAAVTRTQIITIDDTEIPVLVSAPADISVECIEDVPAMTSLTWTDNCDAGGSVLGVDGALIGGECGGTITRIWNVMDGCLNAAVTRTQIITVDDTEIPVLASAPADISVECIEDVPAMTSLTWTDNCDAGGSVLGIDGALVGGECGGTITRSWNVMDGCLNAAVTRTQIITVDDTEIPVLASAPADISVECIEDIPAMTSLSWTDNCDAGGSVLGVDGALVGGECGGTITRIWNVMDGCLNAAVTRTQIITIDDTEIPVLASAPADISVECIEDVPPMTSLTWIDNCDAGGSVLGEDGALVGDECGGTITRSWNVMDACLNAAITRTQIITVDDTEIPVLASAPADISVECIEDVPPMTSLTWIDNCDAGGSVLGEDGALVGGECGGTITRSWNVMDACLNAAITRTQIITVDDTEIPVLASAPADISVECIEDIPAMTSLTWIDNCDAGGSVLGEDGALIGGECGGTITRSWNVMDACLNAAITRTQIITVDDTEIPVLASAPADISVECIEDVPPMTSLTWIDNCDAGGSVLGEDGALVGGECGGTITRSWNVMDACLNAAITRTQIITVDDTEIPVLASAPADISVECIEDIPAMTSLTWIDNCDAGGSVLGEDGALIGGECGGTITRSWNVMDGCLNAAITRTQIITVDDTEIPVLASAPADISVECIEDVPAMTSLTWTDNCDAGGSVLGEDGALVGGECGGTITRSWNVMDGCLNAAVTRTQIITVDDTEIPVLASAPADISVECIEDVPAMTSLTWTDNCDAGGSALGVDGALVGGECGGTITRSWNVMDGCLNAAITRTQIITIDDTEIPVLASAPADISVECIEDVPAMTSLTWTDNCDVGGSVIGVDGALMGGECGGTITRSWNVMDGCLNAAVTRTQIITVDDTEIPVLASAPVDISVECIEDVPAMTSLTWTDNCDVGGSVIGVDGALMGGECGGTITRSWNVMDGCLNAAITRTQIITVDDTMLPELGSAPADISVECIEDVPAMTSLTWTDNCDVGGSVIGVDGALMGGECGGTITRSWNVMDGCLNAAVTRTQIITVDDTMLPELASAPADISVECIEDVPAMTSLTWTDNCDAGGSVLGLDGALVGGECGGTITRSWNVMDGCLNAAVTRTQIITVDDTEIPVLASAPADISVECIEDVPPMTSLTWTDNCDAGGSVLGLDGALVGGECGGTITRSWNVMDGCLNAAITRTQIITLDDTEIPVLASAPADISVECIEDVPAMTSLTWTDNCDAGGSVLGEDGALIGGECGGTITRSWNVMDACLNAAITRTQIITIDDTEIPVLASAPADISVECIEDVPAMTSLTWTDNCDVGGSVIGEDGALMGGECGGTITRSWNVMDGCLNAAITRTQIITVDDTMLPELGSAPADISVECIEDVPAMTSLSWTDNCDAGGSVLGVDGALVGGECGGTITRSWNVMDACLNAAITRTQIITVDDNTAPFLTCPSSLILECLQGGDYIAQINDWILTATATDICDPNISITTDYDGSSIPTLTNELEITFMASDACGNIAQCSASVFLIESGIPSINCPADLTLECVEGSNYIDQINTWIESVTANDGCDDELMVISDYDGSTVPELSCDVSTALVVTFSAIDNIGNTQQCTANVYLDDTIAPIINTEANDLTFDCDGSDNTPALDNWLANNGGASSSDACGGVTWTNDFDGLNNVCGNTGNATVIFTATDNCGNTNTSTATFTIEDNTPPSLDCPDDLTIECNQSIDPLDTGSPINLIDNCDPFPTIIGFSDNSISGSCAQESVIIRTWTVTDVCGNQSTCIQTITIEDTTIPDINCPADISIEVGESTDPFNTGMAMAIDDCSDNLTISHSDIISDCVSETITITRTWTATDECGNVSSCNQIITQNCCTPPLCNINGPDIICGSTTANIYSGPSGMSSYDWTISGDGIITSASNTQDVEVQSFDNGNFTLSLLISTGVNCTSTCSKTVEINPSPVCTISGSQEICETLSAAFYFAPSVMTNYAWSISGGANILGASNTEIVVVENFISGSFTLTLDFTDDNGCSSTCSETITVIEQPSLNITNVVCAPDLLSYSVDFTSNGISIFASLGTVVDNGGGSYSVFGIPTGIPVTISAIITDDCAISEIVNAPDCSCPPVDLPLSGGDQQICEGDQIPALMVSVGAGETADWYSELTGGIPIASGTTSYTPSGAGIFYVETRVIVSHCISDNRIPISLIINEAPIVDPISTSVCLGNSLAIDGAPISGSGIYISHHWSDLETGSASGYIIDNLNGQILSINTASASSGTINFEYTVTDDNECQATSQVNVSINELPNCLINGVDLLCGLSQGINFFGPSNMDNYEWSITGDANIVGSANAQNVSIDVSSIGSFTLSLTVTDGNNCTTLCTKTVMINPFPECNIDGPDGLCEGSTGNTYTAPAGMETYLWSISGSAVISGATNNQDVVVEIMSNGLFFLTLSITDSNGCTANCTEIVFINSLPECNISGEEELCEASVGNAYSAPSGMNSYDWSLTGDGSISGASNEQTVNIDALGEGSFILTLVVTDENDCSTTCSKTIIVNATPDLLISEAICAPDLLTYTIDFTSNGALISSSLGTLINNGGGVYSVVDIPPGNEVVLSAISNNCSIVQTVEAPDCSCPDINAPLSGDDQQICEGNSIPALTVTVGIGETADWYDVPSGGTPIVIGTTSFTPAGSGTFYVETRNIINNCLSNERTVISLIIYNNPVTDPISPEVCLGNNIVIDGAPSGGAGMYSTHFWNDLGTGSASGYVLNNTANQLVTISTTNASAGTIDLEYTVTDDNGCMGTAFISVVINDLPLCLINGVDMLCGLSVGNTYSGPSGMDTYEWSVTGNASIAGPTNGQNVLIDLSAIGSFALSLTVTNGDNCSATCTKIVMINPIPECSITGEDEICESLIENTYSAPSGMTTYLWSVIGSASISGSSNTQDVIVDITSGNSFTLSLTITDANACSSTCTKTVFINPVPECNIIGADALCELSLGNTYSAPPGMNAYQWSITGDGIIISASNAQDVVIEAMGVGSFTLDLWISDGNDCSAICSKIVAVDPFPDLMINSVSCAPDLLTYEIDLISNGATISSSSGIIINNGGGSYTITTIPEGSEVVITSFITANCEISQVVNSPDCSCPDINLPISSGDLEICESDPIPALMITVGAGQTADWYSQPSGGILLEAGTTSYSPSGSGTYYVEARDLVSGCTSSTRTAVTLTINANPTVGPISGSTEVCTNNEVILDGHPIGGAMPLIHNWSISGGTGMATIINQNDGTVSLVGTTAGTVELTYSVIDDNGCSSILVTTIEVEIYAVPTPAILSTDLTHPTECNGLNGSITISGLNPGESYDLSYTQNGIVVSANNILADINGNYILSGLEESNYDDFVISNITNLCASDTIFGPFILEDPEPPSAPILASTSIEVCVGDDVQFEVISPNPLPNGDTILWTGVNNFQSNELEPVISSVANADSGTYEAVLIVNNCVSSATTIEVIVNDLPTAPEITDSGPVCEGEDLVLSVIDPVPGATYEWFNEISGNSIGLGETTVLDSVTIDTSGFYYVVVTINGCTVEAFSNPEIITGMLADIEIEPDDTTCVDVYDLFAEDVSGMNTFWTVGNGGTAIIDFPENPNAIATNLQPGDNLFIWTAVNTCGMEFSDEIIITYFPDTAPDAENDFYETAFEETLSNFDLVVNDALVVPDFELTILSFPQNGILEENDDGTFNYIPNTGFSGTDEFTYSICSEICPDECDTAVVAVTVEPNLDCSIPNIITPNGDGLNDTFIVPCVETYPESSIVIFNRWGDEIYRNEDYKNDWDGTFEGTDLSVGSYFYILKLNDEIRSTFTGFIYIQRN